MLKPVSFRKGREHAPRLSAPYVRGKHHDRYWSDAEKQIVADYYETRGPAYCLTLLPGRTLGGVYQKAAELKLACSVGRERRPCIGASFDEQIRAAWPTLCGKGAVAAFAASIGVSRNQVSHRAKKMGLTEPHKKEPRWTAEEDALLRRAPVNNPDTASAFFKAHGFNRTPASIMVRCKRAGVSRRLTNVLSARKAGDILGIDAHVVTDWIEEGILEGAKRGTKRLPQQGGDTWSITPAALRRFVIDRIDIIDIRKVEKFSFVALLAGAAPSTVRKE